MDKLRIGVIGASGRGSLANHWRDSSRAVVVAGADVRQDCLDDFKARMGEDAFTTLDYRELLAKPDIDAVAVTSPDFTHEDYAVAALEAGKHVFLEKPMAITIEGCDRIIRTQKQTGKKLMIGFNMRCMNMFKVMKDIVDSGTIGEVKAVWVRHFVGHGGSFYYHDWHASRKTATSLLLQKGSHDIDQIHWITGHYSKRVAAFGSLDYFGGDKPNDLTCPECPDKNTCVEYCNKPRRIHCAFRQEVNVEDNNILIMELDNGIKASYLQCHFTPDYHRNYVFIGTEGRMENNEIEGKVWVKTRRSNKVKELTNLTYDVKPASGGHGGGDPVLAEQFLDYIINDTAPVATPIDGRMSVAAGCCGAESMRNGGVPIDIPPIDA